MTMHRSIGPVSHAIIDYVFAILIAIAPRVIGFDGRQATWCYLFAALLFLLALMTRYPLGIVRLVGFVSHGVVELVLAVVLIVLPWAAGFWPGVLSRNFYVCMGLLMIAVWVLTDFRNVRAAGRAAAPKPTAPPAPPPKP
jgi:hypothetical protein